MAENGGADEKAMVTDSETVSRKRNGTHLFFCGSFYLFLVICTNCFFFSKTVMLLVLFFVLIDVKVIYSYFFLILTWSIYSVRWILYLILTGSKTQK